MDLLKDLFNSMSLVPLSLMKLEGINRSQRHTPPHHSGSVIYESCSCGRRTECLFVFALFDCFDTFSLEFEVCA